MTDADTLLEFEAANFCIKSVGSSLHLETLHTVPKMSCLVSQRSSADSMELAPVLRQTAFCIQRPYEFATLSL